MISRARSTPASRGEDLDRAFRVDVITSLDVESTLSMPRDLLNLERTLREVDAGLLLLDPLISRLDPKLDTHRDSEVR